MVYLCVSNCKFLFQTVCRKKNFHQWIILLLSSSSTGYFWILTNTTQIKLTFWSSTCTNVNHICQLTNMILFRTQWLWLSLLKLTHCPQKRLDLCSAVRLRLISQIRTIPLLPAQYTFLCRTENTSYSTWRPFKTVGKLANYLRQMVKLRKPLLTIWKSFSTSNL